MNRYLSILPLLSLVALGCDGAPEAPAAAGEGVGEARQALTCTTVQRGTFGTVSDTQLSHKIGAPPGLDAEGKQNYGSLATADVGRISATVTRKMLLRFAIDFVPPNATVTSATVTLSTTNTGPGTVSVKRVTAPWNGATVTYQSWNNAQASDEAASFLSNPPAAAGLRSFDITALAASWANGSFDNNGMVLLEEAPSTTVATSETANIALRPKLEICYTLPDLCAPSPCQNGGTCTSDAIGYTCACPAGYAGVNCETNVNDCSGNPCQNGGTCTDGVNSYTCACLAGFDGANCEIVDHCAGDPCNINNPNPLLGTPSGVSCTNTPGGYTCECVTPWFAGANCDVMCPCIDDAFAAPEPLQAQAWVFTGLGIAPVPGVCTTTPSGTTTIQLVGNVSVSLSPNSCTAFWDAPLNTYPVTSAAEHTACQNVIDAYLTHYGVTCTADYCSPNPCQNGGTCTSGASSYTCACPAGWTGTNCEVDVDECAAGDPCHINAPAPGTNLPGGVACTNTPGGFTCECSFPFAFGATCDAECPCIDDAIVANDSSTFLSWAFATVGQAPSLSCATDSAGGTTVTVGFVSGPVDLNLSASSCSSSASAPVTYAVSSPADHAACQKMLDAMIALNGLTCSLDNCAATPCQHGGTCTATPDSYTCACPSGWTGTNCEVDVDECASGDPCNLGSALGTSCTNTPGSFTCQCASPIANADCTACSSTPPAVCSNDLSNIGTGDFRIQFTVTTSQTTQAALVSQRAICGSGMFWDTRIVDNRIYFETDDGNGNYSAVQSNKVVNDGLPHLVVVKRVSGVVTLNIDCQVDSSGASPAVLGALPALVQSSACVGNDATVALDGTLTDLCVTH